MGLYITFDDVALRLVGKVRFTNDPADENRMPVALAKRLIDEAEGQVEHDLSPRYNTPFQTVDGQPFAKLPPRPTREILRTLCELQAVMRILETDFGRGTATNGDNYYKALKARYDQVKGYLLEKKSDRGTPSAGWMYPPLLELKLNYFNRAADDGYQGQVIVASGSQSQGYAKGQINHPGENFWNAFPDGMENCHDWRWEEG